MTASMSDPLRALADEIEAWEPGRGDPSVDEWAERLRREATRIAIAEGVAAGVIGSVRRETWSRDEVDIGDVFVSGEDAELTDPPLFYQVVAIADSPTVVLRPLFERDGDEDMHFVISSPIFASWAKVLTRRPGG